MEIGQRLRQARLEAGLSQRQLCGDTITRNMLSQIENGSARPSMDTLTTLAARLGKPVSFFLEEQTASPNQAVILQARRGENVLQLLEDYRAPDPVFDPERFLLEAMACLDAAQAAIEEDRLPLARAYLQQAAQAGEQTPYFTPLLEQRRLLLCHRAGLSAQELAAQLPDWLDELLLRAQAALEQNDPQGCLRILDAQESDRPDYQLLRGRAAFALKDFSVAAGFFRAAEERYPRQCWPYLESCYRELEDFRQAYFYACKLR